MRKVLGLTTTLLLLTLGCQQNTTVGGPGAPSVDAVAAVKPQWLSSAEADALNKDESKKAQIDQMDFFVFFAAQVEGEKAREKLVSAAALIVKQLLHQLFYRVDLDTARHPADDPDFYSALVAFERRANLAVDGKFTVAEFETLNHLARVESELEITPPLKFVSVTELSATAQGTWALQGDTLAYPINGVQIWCWRADTSCSVFTANLALPREDRGSGSAFLLTDVEHYDVFSWTNHEVQARSRSSCGQTVLTINAETKQAYEVTTDLTKEGCPVLGPLGKPKVATLEDGSEAYRKVYESRKAAAKAASNRPLKKIQELMKSAEAR